MTKTIFLTLTGRTNAGKSTLLNALIGEKIASVSSKPQTTRTRITGILTKDETQYVFIDTPGLHKPKNKLSTHMLRPQSPLRPMLTPCSMSSTAQRSSMSRTRRCSRASHSGRSPALSS